MRFAPAEVDLEKRADGTLILRSPQKLGPYSRCITEWLMQWSDRDPARLFLAERKGEAWRRISYREAYGDVRRIGQALLDRRLGAEKPVAILSDNGIDHALLALGAMHAGVPAAPVSPAYSLMSKDYGKLKAIFELVKPGLVFAAEPANSLLRSRRWARARRRWPSSSRPTRARRSSASTARSARTRSPRSCSPRARPASPKGVINTHRMLCANQQMLAQAWPFLRGAAAGAGRLAAVEPHLRRQPQLQPGAAQRRHALHRRRQAGAGPDRDHACATCARSRRPSTSTCRAASTCCCRSWSATRSCARSFFRELRGRSSTPRRRCRRTCGTGWRRSRVEAKRGGDVAMLSAWGSTETAPLATSVHFPIERAGVHRPAGAGLRAQARAGRRQARDARARPERHARLLRRARAHRATRSTRKASTASATPCKLADPARPGEGHRVRRPRRRGLQALDRHLGLRRHAAAWSSSPRRPARAGRGDHRPRPRRDRRARVPEPRPRRSCSRRQLRAQALGMRSPG